jgi:hypothetical protein
VGDEPSIGPRINRRRKDAHGRARGGWAGRPGLGAGDFLTMNADSTYPASKAGWEVSAVRWLEREGYNVAYTTDLDTHEDLGRYASRKAFLSFGHDEYWSKQMRDNAELLRDRGVGMGFFNGNSVYWVVRFEPDARRRANRTMVAFKDAALRDDPYATDGNVANDGEVTVKFRESPVNRPESSLLGVWSGEDAINADLVVSDASQWPFAGTGLVNGPRLPGLVGYEVDLRGPTTPANAVLLAHSPFTSRWNASGYADMITYVAPSGATVFAAGTRRAAITSARP